MKEEIIKSFLCISFLSAQTSGSDDRVFGSEEQEEHQFSDVEESDDEDDNEDDEDEEEDEEEEESTSHEDPPSSCSSDTHPSTGGRSSSARRSQQGTPDPEPGPRQEPTPRGVWSGGRASSPGRRRALFSRKGWKGSPRAFSPSSESCSPSRSLSPRLELSSPIRSLSSPNRHISPSPERRPSPVRAHSPLRPISPSCYRPSQVRTPPSPLGALHRAPGCFPWESPGIKKGHVKPVSHFYY